MTNGVAIIRFQPLAPYEVRQMSRAERRRVRSAKGTKRILKGLDATATHLNYRIRHYESELAATRAKIRDRDAREHRSELGTRTYWSLTAVLLLLEVPLNAAALDFLRRPQLESFGLALFVGAVTALVAKFTGRMLRQKGWSNRAFRDWGVAVVLNLAFALMIWKVAELRGQLAGDPSAGMTVLSLQLVAYVAMVGFSFAHVDPDGDREQLTRLVAVQERRLDRLWRERNGIADQYNKELADGELALADIEHDAIERLAEYRDCNMRRRTEPAPEYFRRPVTRALFEPIDLGMPLDAKPREIGEVIGQTHRENEDE